MNGSPKTLMAEPMDLDRGVYGITTAAELVGTDPQNLRAYERRGLVTPARTPGGTRRYSNNDVDRLNRIRELLDAGLNLAGVVLVLHLEADNAQLRDRLPASDRDARTALSPPGT